MAKLSKLNLVARAERGALLIVRDRTQPIDKTTKEFPPICGVDGQPSTLRLLGSDSMTSRRIDYRAKAEFQTRIYARATTGEQTQGVTPDDIAEQENANLEKLVALTIGWSGFEDEDDAALPCTPENVRALFIGNPDILDQALDFVGDRTRFFDPSLKPSALPVTTDSGSVA